MRADAAVRQLAGELVGALDVFSSPDRAASERAYLKSSYEHLGCSVPAVRSVAKRFLNAHVPDHDQLLALIGRLWDSNIYERRLLCVELLVASPKLLGRLDLDLIESLIRDSRTWALVDSLAGNVTARIVSADPAALVVLDEWVTDDDFWVRRSAVLGLRGLLRNGHEFERFEQYADTLLDEREFFIRKVLGWVARDTGRHHPDRISAWVRANLARMNGVTIREAVKYLPDGEELLTSWKADQSAAMVRRKRAG
jgi:3-methyladenine DNA glycosylase AlkD